MANVLLAFPNQGDVSTLSGGGWQTPLTNLQDYRLSRVARSTDATLANTQLIADMGKDRKTSVVALIAHNLSLSGTWRVRLSDDPTFTSSKYDSAVTLPPAATPNMSMDLVAGVYQNWVSAWMPAWPVIYPFGTLEWEDDNWWEGTITSDDRAAYPGILMLVLPTIMLARYVKIEINDTSNAAGYVQMGRLFVAPGWTPADNMQNGASMNWETDTTMARSLGGTPYFARRSPRRVDKFSLSYLSDNEAKATVFEMQRKLGLDGELLVSWDPNDAVNLLRQSYVGRMRVLNPITTVFTNINSNAFEIEEIF